MIEFRPGQVWRYRTRPHERESRLTVCKVDPDPRLGAIVLVYIDGLAIAPLNDPKDVTEVIDCLPFEVEALRESVTELEGVRDPLPDFEEGYRLWKEHFDRGEAGVYAIPVVEALEHIQQVFDRNAGEAPE